MHRHLLALSLVVSVVVFSVNVYAQWQPTGVPVCSTVYDQGAPALIPDGAGGAIITWLDWRTDGVTTDVFAQRINSFGAPQWAVNGVPVCTAPESQGDEAIISDGGTGAIIAWEDFRNGIDYNIYVQRVNASGVPQWTANGVALCTAAGTQWFPALIPDGAGGAIVIWEDHRGGGAQGDIYARRVNAAGVPQWAADGVGVCTATDNQNYPKVVTDGAGGAIIAWMDMRNGLDTDIFAQRLNASGVSQWIANGVALAALANNQYDMVLLSDGAGGAIGAWEDLRNGVDVDIFAQRVNGAGTTLWQLGGNAVVSQTGTQEFPSIASDGANGAIIAWDDTRNGPASDVYAQHVGASGNPQWSLGGVAISTATLYQTNPFVTTDSNGGAVILWRDNRGFSSIDIYAQRVNALGVTQWTPDGVQLTTAPANASTTPLVWDGNAVITAFTDFRNGPGDIYAQRVEGHYGYWGHPEPVVTSVADVPKDQGGHVAVNWTASQRDVTNPHTVDSYTIWRAVNTVPFGVDASQVLQDIKDARGKRGHIYLSAGPATDYYWELVGTQAAHGWAGYSFSAETRADSVAGNSANERFMVAAQTNADNFVAFQSNAVQGHSVDNLAPATPLLLTISQAGANAVLNWKPVPDADLAHYTLYRKTGSGVTPVIGNFLTQESLTNHIDAGAAAGGYYYIVVAVDAHGNMSAPSNEVSLNGSTGVDGATPLAHLVVDANAPNPFASQSEFRVGLPRAANIDVSLYDVGGRLVGVRHVAGVKGWQKVAIDGRDTSGRALASGVYFYRVSAAGETITRKMVIAR